MKIAIEAQRIFRPNKHGMDFVILEVLRELQKRKDGNEYYVLVAPGEDRCLETSDHLTIIELHCPTYPLWEQVALPLAVRRLGADLLHCTSNTAPLYSPVPVVLTLHDVIFLTSEKESGMSMYQQLGWHYRRWNVPRIVGKCRHILTVSHTARTRILSCFPDIAPRLSVAHNGCSGCYRPLPDEETRRVTARYLPDPHYLLFFGSTDPRKNTRGVLTAYHDYLRRSALPQKLVVTGLERETVLRLLAEMGIEACAPHLVFTGYVPGDDLPALYNGASAFLFPSLQEGFGIPPLEAMACGTPVVTSNCSALPEVAGDAALTVDPHHPQAIADALLALEADDTLRRTLAERGLERAKSFSWAHTAEEYRKIYHQIHH